jgi:hypothetical protein
MEEEAQLVGKFTTFFHEVLPLFKITDKQQADIDLADPRNIHTFLYFLKKPEQKALIVNWRNLEEGKSRFYLHLNPKEVGDVNKGFTLIKRPEFDASKKFKHVFHAISLEPLLVTRIDALLFEELITSMHPEESKFEAPANKPASAENSHILTFGQEHSILPTPQEEGYISITEEANGLPVKSKTRNDGLRATKTGLLGGNYSSNQKGSSSEASVKNGPDSNLSENQAKVKRPVEFQSNEQVMHKAPVSPRASISGLSSKQLTISNRTATPRRVEELRRSQVKKDSETPRSPSPSRGLSSRSASTRKLVEASQDLVTKMNTLKTAKVQKEFESIQKSSTKKPNTDVDSSRMISPSSKEGLATDGNIQKSKKKKVFYVQESLEEARNQLKQSKGLIPEICTYHNPEQSLLLALQSIVHLMTGKKLPWVKIKIELKKPTWLKDFLEFEPKAEHGDTVEDIIKECLASDDWDCSKPGSLHAKQSKAKPFAEWVETFCAEVKKLQHPGKEEFYSELSLQSSHHHSASGLSQK